MSKGNERAAHETIEGELAGLRLGGTISRGCARLIAAAAHRGADSELRRFAETGSIRRHQVARLELFYTTAGEPALARWADALKAFITEDERRGETRGRRSGP